MVKMNLPSGKVVKEKEIHARFAVEPKLQVMAAMLDKCLVRMEKALSFKIFWEKKDTS